MPRSSSHSRANGSGCASPAPSPARRLSPAQEAYLEGHARWLAEHGDDDGLRDPGPAPADWSGASLAKADLGRAVLVDVDFRGADLSGANLRDSDLSNADLSRANLAGATLSKANFRGASFRDARGVDGDQLSCESTGGADLRGTGVDQPDRWKDGLKSVEEVSKYLQGLYKILLAICGFGTLTVVSFRDEQLLDHGGTSMTQLPVFQATISPSMFVIVVPLFTLVLYIYMLIYVFTLWRELSYLPAYFPDGAALDRKAYPMLLSSYVRVHFKRLEEGPPSWFQMIVASLMEFGVPTAATFTFWACCLRKHDLPTSVIEAAAFAATAGLSLSFVVMARPLLRQWDWEDWSPVPWLSRRWPEKKVLEVDRRSLAAAYRAAAALFLAGAIPVGLAHLAARALLATSTPWAWAIASGVALLTSLMSLAWCIAWGLVILVASRKARFRVAVLLSWTYALPVGLTLWVASSGVFASGNDTFGEPPRDYKPAGPVHLLRYLGVNPFLDLSGKVISSRPAGLSGKVTLDSDEINLVVGPDLEGADLRSLDANRVYLVRANLRGARLDHANLRNADLRGADLRGASLRGAILRNASLRDTWLRGADLSGALLRGDDPREPMPEGQVDLQGARLAGVICRAPADLKGARNFELAYYGVRDEAEVTADTREENDDNKVFREELGLPYWPDRRLALKDLEGYEFHSTNLQGADLDGFNLRGARFQESTVLRGARLTGADLRGARLAKADLREADFRRAKLDGLDLKGAAIVGADLTGADLGHVVGLTRAQIESAKVDGATRPPLVFDDVDE